MDRRAAADAGKENRMTHEDQPASGDTHQGRFSEGQEEEPEDLEKGHRGDFAEGQEGPHESSDLRRGDFAEGQEDLPHSHVRPLHGDFAEGQEKEPR